MKGLLWFNPQTNTCHHWPFSSKSNLLCCRTPKGWLLKSRRCLIREEEEAVSTIGNEMNAFEEMAAEWQRRLTVITAMLLASESESERRNLPLFTDSSLLQPQADGAQEWVQREENALLLCPLLIDQRTWKTLQNKKIRRKTWNFFSKLSPPALCCWCNLPPFYPLSVTAVIYMHFWPVHNFDRYFCPS